ncbi:MAG: DUF418 domain-containing protein [Caulobacteraceae bacterium]
MTQVGSIVEEELAGPPEAPVARGERLATLDVLRGFALLGILAVNIEDFAGPESLHDIPMGVAKAAFVGWHAHLDLFILTIKWLFVEGKMRAMFAMLFGAGAVLLTERIERRGQAVRAADIYLRRCMWLALFGLIHGTLIWGGDILLIYGLSGLLFLYPFRHVKPSRLIGLGVALWLVVGTFGLSNFLHAPQVLRDGELAAAAAAAHEAGRTPTKAQQGALDAALDAKKKEPAQIAQAVQEGRQGYIQGLSQRAAGDIDFVTVIFRSGFVFEVVGAMLLGMGLYKTGFLPGRLSTRTYLATAIVGYAISAPIVMFGIWRASLDGFSKPATTLWMFAPYCLEQIAAMLANASVLILLIRKGWLRPVLNRLGAVGRTAFSNYILTSLSCQFIFAWGPWKLYGALEYYQYLYVVAAVWAVNLTVSSLWLRVFAFGPLEWMWRSLTYWKRQPFRLTSQKAASGGARSPLFVG